MRLYQGGPKAETLIPGTDDRVKRTNMQPKAETLVGEVRTLTGERGKARAETLTGGRGKHTDR